MKEEECRRANERAEYADSKLKELEQVKKLVKISSVQV